MINDAMSAGVARGGLTNKTEIKVLICYLLKVFDSPLPLDKLKEDLHFEGIANYFELAAAIGDLEASLVIAPAMFDGVKKYLGTNRSLEVVDALGKSLPLTVKEKSCDIVAKYLSREKMAKENKVSIEKCGEGYTVTCSVCEKDLELVSVKLFVTSEVAANNVKNRFLDDPAKLLIEATESLTGEKF